MIQGRCTWLGQWAPVPYDSTGAEIHQCRSNDSNSPSRGDFVGIGVPVCGLHCLEGRCDHTESFMQEVSAKEVTTQALELIQQKKQDLSEHIKEPWLFVLWAYLGVPIKINSGTPIKRLNHHRSSPGSSQIDHSRVLLPDIKRFPSSGIE
jgi:hypothetical protein